MQGLPVIDLVVLIGYFIIVAIIGLCTAAKVKTQKDFYVGGRSFGKLLDDAAIWRGDK